MPALKAASLNLRWRLDKINFTKIGGKKHENIIYENNDFFRSNAFFIGMSVYRFVQILKQILLQSFTVYTLKKNILPTIDSLNWPDGITLQSFGR